MRSGVKTAAAFGLLASLFGCEDDPPLPPREREVTEHAPPPGATSPPPDDGGPLPDKADDLAEADTTTPRAPFNLTAAAASFTTIDACIAQAKRQDALLTDTLEELGFESLRADACRIVAAVHDKSAEPCKGSVLAPLAHACRVAAAVTLEDPVACPPVDVNDPTRGRDALCVALASHRTEPCEALEASDAVNCRATLRQSRALCKDAPTRARRGACLRTLERWRGLARELDAPTSDAHATLLRSDGERSLDDLARVGAVLVEKGKQRTLVLDASKGRMRLKLRLRLGATDHATIEAFELTEAGSVLASGQERDAHAEVKLSDPDAGTMHATISLRSMIDGPAFRSFVLTTSVRDHVRTAP